MFAVTVRGCVHLGRLAKRHESPRSRVLLAQAGIKTAKRLMSVMGLGRVSQAEVMALIFNVCFTPTSDIRLTVRHFHFGPQAVVGELYSITSSARASSDGGTVRPSVFAVLRLITSSYLVGACTGRSAGFSPLRMRST